jgi:NTP pyrophosphohydrolases containing a Zn-finger, probably nucleic-acid-binding
MIQDIEQNFDNQYKSAEPQDNDSVFYFAGQDLLIYRDDEDKLELPTIADFRHAGFRDDYQYLFEIGGKGHYLYTGKPLWPTDSHHEPMEGVNRLYKSENFRNLRQVTSKEICFAAATAYHLYVWYRDNQFCGRCGMPLIHLENERMLECPTCGNQVFPKIAPAVIVAVTSGDKILLTKYADRVYKKYALIAGFTEIGETTEETVHREVMEEVGLSVRNVRYYKSQPWGADSNLLMGFFADLDGSPDIDLDTDELSTAAWFDRDNLPVQDDGISLTRDMIEAYRAGWDREHN